MRWCSREKEKSARAKKEGDSLSRRKREREREICFKSATSLYRVLYLWFSRAIVVFVSIPGSVRPIMQPSLFPPWMVFLPWCLTICNIYDKSLWLLMYIYIYTHINSVG